MMTHWTALVDMIPARREALAQALNGALLSAQGGPVHPAVEQLYRQAASVLEELKGQGNPAVTVLDIARLILSTG